MNEPSWLPTRRTFLTTTAAAACVPLAHPARRPPTADKQKILVLGGTNFLGPAVVEAALARGHELTLFNRGKTNPHLFPDVEKLHGNRRRAVREGWPPQDLTALNGRKWDAVVDTSGYYTGEVEDVTKLLAGAVGHYVFISSLSAYRDMEQNNNPVHEDSPLATCADKYVPDMGKNFEHYGALKAFCEAAVAAAFPGRAALVRPGYIVGPRDSSDRFTYWPMRLARGGDILAPGDPGADLQFIDVRDLGSWIVHAIEQRLNGAYNAVGFKGRISVQEFLHTGKGTLNHECAFTWVDDAFLEQHGVTSWEEMPCWTPKAKAGRAGTDKAIAAGMTFRPIAETIRDTWQWAAKERSAERPWRAGMKPEREQDLLAAWRAR